jgi:glutamine amidotransferase
VLGAADYGVPLPALIQSGSIIACQFHPEKSGEAGLRILQAFCGIGQIPHAETQRRRGEFG